MDFFLVNTKLCPNPQFQRIENTPKVGWKSKQTALLGTKWEFLLLRTFKALDFGSCFFDVPDDLLLLVFAWRLTIILGDKKIQMVKRTWNLSDSFLLASIEIAQLTICDHFLTFSVQPQDFKPADNDRSVPNFSWDMLSFTCRVPNSSNFSQPFPDLSC